MPSRRSRSRSNERSKSPERRAELPNGVSPITESQYFQKSDEFRLWLKEEKSKVRKTTNTHYKRGCMFFFNLMARDFFLEKNTQYFDSLSGDRARRCDLTVLLFYHALTVKIVRQLFSQICKGMNMTFQQNWLVLINRTPGMEQRTAFT